MKEKLNVLIPLAQNAVEESRRICNGLRPSILDDMGIVSTLRWLCREFRRTCPAIYLSERLMTAENDIPEPLKIVIFRIAQEAINNAAKYSRADHVDLWLSRTGNEIELIVEDSGVGFDVTEALSRTPDARGLGTYRNAGKDRIFRGLIFHKVRRRPGDDRLCLLAPGHMTPSRIPGVKHPILRPLHPPAPAV